jgi:hypothetical protein
VRKFPHTLALPILPFSSFPPFRRPTVHRRRPLCLRPTAPRRRSLRLLRKGPARGAPPPPPAGACLLVATACSATDQGFGSSSSPWPAPPSTGDLSAGSHDLLRRRPRGRLFIATARYEYVTPASCPVLEPSSGAYATAVETCYVFFIGKIKGAVRVWTFFNVLKFLERSQSLYIGRLIFRSCWRFSYSMYYNTRSLYHIY